MAKLTQKVVNLVQNDGRLLEEERMVHRLPSRDPVTELLHKEQCDWNELDQEESSHAAAENEESFVNLEAGGASSSGGNGGKPLFNGVNSRMPEGWADISGNNTFAVTRSDPINIVNMGESPNVPSCTPCAPPN